MSDERATSDEAAESLLDREHPAHYLQSWTRSLQRKAVDDSTHARFSAGVVRLGEERFAIPTENVVEVRPVPVVRALPGRTNDVFRGLVTLRGEIYLCASLRALLGMAVRTDTNDEDRRLVVVERDGERWALLVDQVIDFRRFDADDVQAAQTTVAKSAVHFTDGVVPTEVGPAARIDMARLFQGLARSLA